VFERATLFCSCTLIAAVAPPAGKASNLQQPTSTKNARSLTASHASSTSTSTSSLYQSSVSGGASRIPPPTPTTRKPASISADATTMLDKFKLFGNKNKDATKPSSPGTYLVYKYEMTLLQH
jgi:hypothetical protein